jgi:hypothetical protein
MDITVLAINFIKSKELKHDHSQQLLAKLECEFEDLNMPVRSTGSARLHAEKDMWSAERNSLRKERANQSPRLKANTFSRYDTL